MNSALILVRHQPLTEVSGMDRGLDNAPKQIMAKGFSLLHPCTHARLHAERTLVRSWWRRNWAPTFSRRKFL